MLSTATIDWLVRGLDQLRQTPATPRLGAAVQIAAPRSAVPKANVMAIAGAIPRNLPRGSLLDIVV
jgi:hypothetical protein